KSPDALICIQFTYFRDLKHNYCRNPNCEKYPWCYTTDPESQWEYCEIPKCQQTQCFTGSGAAYKGTVSKTVSGKTCQRWDSQEPHEHTRTPGQYLDKGLIHNYCRNPDCKKAPWCYTTDQNTTWEYCPVPNCEDYKPGKSTNMWCYTGDNGDTYRGIVSYTASGKTCQRWDSQEPHKHSSTQEHYADK
uniref:Kringle domain-containing protein n=1 Tax=Callorhinchus milii TaxID=7868 RepID=A0A4W3H445_CALMI